MQQFISTKIVRIIYQPCDVGRDAPWPCALAAKDKEPRKIELYRGRCGHSGPHLFTFAMPLRRSSAFMTGTISTPACRSENNGSTTSIICDGSARSKKIIPERLPSEGPK